MQQTPNRRRHGIIRRRRVPGTRAHQACVSCKERKLKCDDQVPACMNCRRLSVPCLVQDLQTKQHRPRNYLQVLEGRVAVLEGRDERPDASSTSSPSGLNTPSNNASSHSAAFSPDEGETPSELSSKVGMLEIRTTHMEPQYLGSSSTFAFSRIVNLNLIQGLPNDSSFPLHNDRRQSSPSPCLLPDRDAAITLSDAYFKFVHPQYPFLHEPTFRSWEAMFYDSSPDMVDMPFDSVPLFFLNMVYAVAALLLPNTGSLAEQLYTSAQFYTEVLSRDNLEAIQALLCYAMYSLRSLTGPSLWKLSGLALRQCIELGYHRSSKRLASTSNLVQLEMRRRVFWVAHGIDCTIALRLGRPMGIPLAEVDVEFPSEIDDTSMSMQGLSSPPENSSRPATSISIAIYVAKLRCIWSRIHTSLFSDTSHGNAPSAALEARVIQLRAELDDWLATAPDSKPSSKSDLSMFATKDWFELNYSYTILFLYRAQIVRYTETSDPIFQECIEAARNICQRYRKLYIGTSIKYTWGTLHCIFLAGLTYLHCLWTSPTICDSIRPEEVSKTCTDCTMVLVAIAEGWQGAAPYRDTFEALAAKTITMMMGRSRATSPLRLPIEPEAPEEGSWADWMNDVVDTRVLEGVDGLLAGFLGDLTPGMES